MSEGRDGAMKITTLDGTTHKAHYESRVAHQINGGRIRDLVLVADCGVNATGSTTSNPVDCPRCQRYGDA
jgi:hypothetical protein